MYLSKFNKKRNRMNTIYSRNHMENAATHLNNEEEDEGCTWEHQRVYFHTNIYILDANRMTTESPSEYFDNTYQAYLLIVVYGIMFLTFHSCIREGKSDLE
jgi:hypothetical protein